MNKILLVLFLYLSLSSCGPLSKDAKYNEYSFVQVNEKGYQIKMIKNKKKDFIVYYPAGYSNPKNNREAKKILKGKTEFSDLSEILVIAIREEYDNDFYILLNPKKIQSIDTLNYTSEVFRKDDQIIQLIMKNSIVYEEKLFIKENIYINYDRPKVKTTLTKASSK